MKVFYGQNPRSLTLHRLVELGTFRRWDAWRLKYDSQYEAPIEKKSELEVTAERKYAANLCTILFMGYAHRMRKDLSQPHG